MTNLFPTPAEYVFYTRPDAPQLTWKGKHRTWTLTERQGTALSDQFTILSTPIPGGDNPAGDYEDGQYTSVSHAYDALLTAEERDTGSHMD